MNKKQATELAQSVGWTKADAERAFTTLDFKSGVTECEVWVALSRFAGSELEKRQRLQAAQKGQVIKKDKYIKEIELNHATKIHDYENKLQQERSQWQQLLNYVYNTAKRFGFTDSLIEKILGQNDIA